MRGVARWLLVVLAAAWGTAYAERPVEGAAQTEFFDEIWRSVELYGDRSGEKLPFVKFRFS